jgi:uncharacterized membrane protein
VKEREQITEIRSRFQEKQSNLKNIMNKKREKIDKWMQVFVFPIILVVVNNLINSETDTYKVFAYTSSILIIFLCIYIVVIGFLTISNIFENVRISKYDNFITDLQGVMDIKYGIKIHN